MNHPGKRRMGNYLNYPVFCGHCKRWRLKFMDAGGSWGKCEEYEEEVDGDNLACVKGILISVVTDIENERT